MATLNQEQAVKETLENLGQRKKVAIGKILLKNGYSKAIAKNPKIVTESKGWQELMEKSLPDTLLAKVHKEGLKATKHQGVGGMVMGIEAGAVKSVGHTEIEVPDYATRHKYLDTAYKLKGVYAAEKNINLNLDATVDLEGIDAIVDVLNNQMKNVYQGTGTWQDLPKDTN